mmetsp:Transcript_8369/g.9333  ORF Transcript_8369/g.9333 Transcript_8369/m.9333 type:complete len:222 (+) Transcript_8369:70-735(+)
MAKPDPNKNYPVVLGSSFTEDADTPYHNIQYSFVKSSVDYSVPGKLSLKDQKINIEYYNAEGDLTSVLEGKMGQAKTNECVLIFEGDRFVLERLGCSAVNLTHKEPKTALKRKASSHVSAPQPRQKKPRETKIETPDFYPTKSNNEQAEMDDYAVRELKNKLFDMTQGEVDVRNTPSELPPKKPKRPVAPKRKMRPDRSPGSLDSSSVDSSDSSSSDSDSD